MYTFSILLAKTVNILIRFFKFGSGHTWPGHVVLKLYPNIILEINKKLPEKRVFISGTNGKTTTAKLVRHVLEKQGVKVLHNDTGANLVNGIVSSVLLNSGILGNLDYEVVVFELDETTLPVFVKDITPNILALLNLSRDQLDRHWEVDIVFNKWIETVKSLPLETTLILDKTQPRFSSIDEVYQGEVLYFNEDRSHLSNTNLVGSFNAKNVNCALMIGEKLGVSISEAKKSLQDFSYAYGRGEEVSYQGKSWQILLAKNPESLDQNLKLLLEEQADYDTILYILNDNIPDGLDVSWIYDVDPKFLREASAGKQVFVSGVRALDMAVRLQYSGVEVEQGKVESSIQNSVRKLSSDEQISRIVVLPNYSAMLEFRKILTGKKIL